MFNIVLGLVCFTFEFVHSSIITLSLNDVTASHYYEYSDQGVSITATIPDYGSGKPCTNAPIGYPNTQGCRETWLNGFEADPSGQNQSAFFANFGDMARTHLYMDGEYFSVLSMDVFEFIPYYRRGSANQGVWHTLDFTEGQTYTFHDNTFGNGFSNVQFVSFISGSTAPVYFDNIVIETQAVPEPGSLALLLFGLTSVGIWRRKTVKEQ